MARFKRALRQASRSGLYDPATDSDNCGVALLANIDGHRSRDVVSDALSALRRMTHRSGRGADGRTGDGSGILVGLSHDFMSRVARRDADIELPRAGRYGVAMVFLPQDADTRQFCRERLEHFTAAQGQRVLGWRRVPAHAPILGPAARASQPVIEQLFVAASDGAEAAAAPDGVDDVGAAGTPDGADYARAAGAAAGGAAGGGAGPSDSDAFERQLYLIRKQAYRAVRESGRAEAESYHVASFSTRILVYKGQLTPAQLPRFYPDLADPRMKSHVAIVHTRFSTNTFPSWARAQPMRYSGHNGEINTLRGNTNWMRARQGLMASESFGDEIEKLYPIINPETSDSGILDNVLELLCLSGRSLPEAVNMMIPEAWEGEEKASTDRRAFHEYHASLMEPWDGPASVLFTDGRCAGAVLDRNGLRPSRYWITHDGRVILASEVGVVDVPVEDIREKGRVPPGRMFLVDFERGRIIPDAELMDEMARRNPYAQWLDNQKIGIAELDPRDPPADDGASLSKRLNSFGYTSEQLSMLLGPMAETGKDPRGAMGNDAPLACLSNRVRLPYDYLKELFAQVTNPPIDSIRERVVMSLACATGPEGNLLASTEAQAHRLWIPRPVLCGREMAALKSMDHRGWRARTIDITMPRAGTAPEPGESPRHSGSEPGEERERTGEGERTGGGERIGDRDRPQLPEGAGEALVRALDRICREARAAIRDGYRYIVLSDRKAGAERVPVSALLATGAVHHHLVAAQERTRIGIAVESGEPREVHHFCALIGFGADAVHPYLALEAVRAMEQRDRERRKASERSEARYRRGDRDQGTSARRWGRVREAEGRGRRRGARGGERVAEVSGARRVEEEGGVERYLDATAKGMLKVMAKMGISTLASYKGAQVFEAVGVGPDVMDRCFIGTASRIAGIGLDVFAREAFERHAAAYPDPAGAAASDAEDAEDAGDSEDARDGVHAEPVPPTRLPHVGEFHWRPEGEAHMWNPETIANLQQAARGNSPQAYEDFARAANEDARIRCTLRGLLEFRTHDDAGVALEDAARSAEDTAGSADNIAGSGDAAAGALTEDAAGSAIPLEEVEPVSEIVKRFCTGAMSFGALSSEAHETLAVALNRLGGKSNSGEGGEDPARAHPRPSGDSARSAIKQVASGRFGVSIDYLASADQIQIKMAQGAKPGEGGELPGKKVSEAIARVRNTTPGVMLISPPPHHDVYSIEDLAQLIHDLKNANPLAAISVKLVAAVGVGAIAAGVAKAGADHILISGHDGGTGASALTSIRHAGLPWEMGIAEAQHALVANGLRSRVRMEIDGQLKTGRDVAIAALLGAEEFGFSTAPLITLGCIMMRKCHLNTCPVGVATQDPTLRARFSGIPEHVTNYLFMVAEEARRIMASLGFRTMNEMIGRADRLYADAERRHWKSKGLDLSLLLEPCGGREEERRFTKPQDSFLDDVLDQGLIREAAPALDHGEPIRMTRAIHNEDRTAGTLLSHQVISRWGAGGLPDGTIKVQLDGSAGQSLGAWLAPGIDLTLEGDANDYVGKGLSGGRLVIRPPRRRGFIAEDDTIIGNVALYGAVRGEAFVRGLAGERFAVRNSGASAVVEGVGDHGCEYMTGGRVVVLGPTGRNFAAGMSGGIAYVHDPAGRFPSQCNTELVELGGVTSPQEIDAIRGLIERHWRLTGSGAAVRVLEAWERAIGDFVRIIPVEYARALDRLNRAESDPRELRTLKEAG